jgi:hypothetical protein
MKLPLLMVLAGLCALPAAAQDNRWVTFKTIRDKWGKAEHQIDRTTIRQEGPYRVFWTRVWLPARKQQLSFSNNYQLYMISQKFAVDCVHRRFANHYIDSTVPMERKRNADLRAVRWTGLDKNPIVDRAVCGNRR